MRHYTLHELEKLTGILAATIRVWERRYNIIKLQRTGTNRRWYNDEDLRRFINSSILYQNGIKISKIAAYSGSGFVLKRFFNPFDISEICHYLKHILVNHEKYSIREA